MAVVAMVCIVAAYDNPYSNDKPYVAPYEVRKPSTKYRTTTTTTYRAITARRYRQRRAAYPTPTTTSCYGDGKF